MKASELNIYDWLFIDGEAQQVMPTLIDHLFFGCNEVDIKPIPLTADILLANGFEYISTRNTRLYKLWKSEKEIIWAEIDGIYFSIYTVVDRGEFKDILVEYVHDFQHLLRQAGFLELADELKLEEGGNR